MLSLKIWLSIIVTAKTESRQVARFGKEMEMAKEFDGRCFYRRGEVVIQPEIILAVLSGQVISMQ